MSLQVNVNFGEYGTRKSNQANSTKEAKPGIKKLI